MDITVTANALKMTSSDDTKSTVIETVFNLTHLNLNGLFPNAKKYIRSGDRPDNGEKQAMFLYTIGQPG